MGVQISLRFVLRNLIELGQVFYQAAWGSDLIYSPLGRAAHHRDVRGFMTLTENSDFALVSTFLFRWGEKFVELNMDIIRLPQSSATAIAAPGTQKADTGRSQADGDKSPKAAAHQG